MLKAIVANALAPALLDGWLAIQGTRGQQTGEPALEDQADNLTAPVPGDFGANGRFVSEADGRIWSVSPVVVRATLLTVFGLLAAVTSLAMHSQRTTAGLSRGSRAPRVIRRGR